MINGIEIYNPEKLPLIIKKKNVQQIFIAFSSNNKDNLNNILQKIKASNVQVFSIPRIEDMMSGLKKITDIKELEINKLFGRKSVLIEDKLLGKRVLKNNILITGAGGSIGSELCKISIKHNPRKLILLDISEFALHSIYLELNRIKENHKQIKTKLVPILGSINDKKLIENIFKKYQFESVYHAAAYKHVKLVEENKTSGIVNNVIGTKILVKVSIKYSSKNFVLVSSDKAVKPTNLMGQQRDLQS